MFEKGQLLKTKSGLVGSFRYLGGPDKDIVVLVVEGEIVCVGLEDLSTQEEPKEEVAFDPDYYVVKPPRRRVHRGDEQS